MTADKKMNIGLVGACARGGRFKAGCDAVGLNILAVCDTNADDLSKAAERLGAPEQYTDYQEMLEKSDLDAVIIGTPMQLHVPQSVAALERNIHVLCEVPAGVSIEECRRLVEVATKSRAVYMMAENYAYMKPNVLVRELAGKGMFGQPYYAEGEYLHELKDRNELTPWRRTWQTGIAGVTYCTHSLGPILQWMPGDRVVSVCCEDTDIRHKDPRGDKYGQMTPVMLCKTANGALIKIRVDMLSDRPHAMANYSLQGMDGAYESSRGHGGANSIWLRSLDEDVRWHDLDELAEEHMPEMWRNPSEDALASGHGGGDFYQILDFANAITGQAPCPIGIHKAMDITLPGLISQQSIQQGGWLPVPDSRQWAQGLPKKQLMMLLHQDRLDSPPPVELPEGYSLRTYRPTDADAYLELMHKAGFEYWTMTSVKQALLTALPDGLFLVVHDATGTLAATAMAGHSASDLHPFGGQLGWVAGDPEHTGQGLGQAVCSAVVRRYLAAGYKRIYLTTDDWRFAAIKIYFRLGFVPMLTDDKMKDRWRDVCEKLSQPFQPEQWPQK